MAAKRLPRSEVGDDRPQGRTLLCFAVRPPATHLAFGSDGAAGSLQEREGSILMTHMLVPGWEAVAKELTQHMTLRG